VAPAEGLGVVRWWTLTSTELVRLFRDRGNIFFVLIFPLLLVVLIGASFGAGSGGAVVGIVAADEDDAVRDLRAALDGLDAVRTVDVDDAEDLRDEVARGALSAGIEVPAGYAAQLAAGERVELAYVGRQDGSAPALRAVVEGAVAEQAALAGAATAASDATGRTVEETTAVAREVAGQLPGVAVVATEVAVEGGLAAEFAGLGQFDLGASTQLFLFTFLTALAGGAALIQTRQYGVAKRVLSTSTPAGTVLAGFAGGRIAVALLQAAYIVIATRLLFGVRWGDPLAATVVIVLFCLVAGGAGMLVGATLDNESQASGVGVGLGLGLAAFGGSMVPLEVFPPALQQAALVTPHAWANRAMAELVRRDGTLGDVLLEVTALAAFAVVLLVGATVALRRTLTR
jgi:ABC-2 type transport system permease protein